MRPATIFVSATPGEWELQKTEGIFVEQVIRPTGLVDPVCAVRPVQNQVDDLLADIKIICPRGGRVLITVLTKKMAENLTDYLHEHGVRVRYMHSDIETLERIEIIRDLRLGVFDVLVGINLLREGLDIPECQLVAILDADKEGFLRSTRSLIQTIGRAARNVDGRVTLYADRITDSLKKPWRKQSAGVQSRLHGMKRMALFRKAFDPVFWISVRRTRITLGTLSPLGQGLCHLKNNSRICIKRCERQPRILNLKMQHACAMKLGTLKKELSDWLFI